MGAFGIDISLLSHLPSMALPRGDFAADDPNELITAGQGHAAPTWAEKEPLPRVVGIDQADPRAGLDVLDGIVGARARLVPNCHRLADGFGATRLACDLVGGFEP
jgi:hypothetical protein